MVEVEDALADEQRLDHAEVFEGHCRIAEGLADADHARIGLDLDQPTLAAKAAAARHAVGLLRGEGIFQADEGEASDGVHGLSFSSVFTSPVIRGRPGGGKTPTPT